MTHSNNRYLPFARQTVLVLTCLSLTYCDENNTLDTSKKTVEKSASEPIGETQSKSRSENDGLANGSNSENSDGGKGDPSNSDESTKSFASTDSVSVKGRALVTFGVAKMLFSPEAEEKIAAGETPTDTTRFKKVSHGQYYVPLSDQGDKVDPVEYLEGDRKAIIPAGGRKLIKRDAANRMVISPAYIEDADETDHIISETYGNRSKFSSKRDGLFSQRWFLDVVNENPTEVRYILHDLDALSSQNLTAELEGTVLSHWQPKSWQYSDSAPHWPVPSIIPSPEESLMLMMSAGHDNFNKRKSQLVNLSLIDPLKPSQSIYLTGDTSVDTKEDLLDDHKLPTVPVWVNESTFYWTKGNKSSITKCHVPFRLEVTCTDYPLVGGSDEKPMTVDEIFTLPGHPDHLVARVSVKPEDSWWKDHFELLDLSGETLRRVQMPFNGSDSSYLDITISPSGSYVAFRVRKGSPFFFYLNHDALSASLIPTPYIDRAWFNPGIVAFSPNPDTDQILLVGGDNTIVPARGEGYAPRRISRIRASLLQLNGDQPPTHTYLDKGEQHHPVGRATWSPDGNWIVYNTWEKVKTPYPERRIYAVNVHNKTADLPYVSDPITTNGYLTFGQTGSFSAISAWSSDHLQLYYVARKSAAQPYGSLYVTDINSSGQRHTAKGMDLAINERITSLEATGSY